MRRAQALLDEAQAERSRTLAAFAVTVGDDGSTADLMGLNEREVRLARRTVGRSDARSLAQELLTRKTPKTEESSDEPAAPGPEVPLPHPREEMAAPAADAGTEPPPVPPVPAMPPAPPPAPQPQAGTGDHTATWSPSMDSVLLWSWESGLDVQTVAAELGLDVRSLLMRLQELANDGMLTLAHPVTEVTRSGRHRRQNFDDQAYAALFSPTATFPTHMPY